MDLLTVVMHELGYSDVDGTVRLGNLMSETLTPGVRRLPQAAAVTSQPAPVPAVAMPTPVVTAAPTALYDAVAPMTVTAPSSTATDPVPAVALAAPMLEVSSVTSQGPLFGEVTMLQLPPAEKPAPDDFAIGGVFLG